MQRKNFRQISSLVVKVGSSLLTGMDGKINHDFIHRLGKQLRQVQEECPEIILVSSGAVAAGLPLLGWNARPATFTDLQVAAAVGQIHLSRVYDEIFTEYGFRTAQYLLTSNDLSDRRTFLNSRSTLRRLVELGLLPVVNENDALAIDSRRLGDNDHFAAEIANLIEADLMVILTDVEGIYTNMLSKEVLVEAMANDPSLQAYSDEQVQSKYGSGGMSSKIAAAKRASASGTNTIIASGYKEDVLVAIQQGKQVGSFLTAPETRMRAKERWLAHSANPEGSVTLDPGAVASVCSKGKSLLPIGIVSVQGNFQRGDVISINNGEGSTVAKGLSNYDAKEVEKLLRKHSREIEAILGYVVADEVVHCDNMVTTSE